MTYTTDAGSGFDVVVEIHTLSILVIFKGFLNESAPKHTLVSGLTFARTLLVLEILSLSGRGVSSHGAGYLSELGCKDTNKN